MPFLNPVVGGNGALIRPAIKSPNYVPGVSGWSINRDGSAEFNNVTVRGSLYLGTANRYIRIDTITGIPRIELSDDLATYPFPSQIYASTNSLNLTSPSATGSAGQAGIALIGDTTGGPRVELQGNDVIFDRYAYQIGANLAQVTANSAAVAPGANVTVVSLFMDNLIVGRRYRITIAWHGVIFGTPVAVPGNRGTMHIAVDGAFATAGVRILGHNAGGFSQFGGSTIGYHVATATSHTYAMVLQHEAASTAATLACSAVADSPATIAVEGWSD